MALTTDSIEKDLKKILNISSIAKVDLEKKVETDRLPNGFHTDGAFAPKAIATADCSGDHGMMKESGNAAKSRGDGFRKYPKKDHFKPGNINTDGYNGHNSNSDPDIKFNNKGKRDQIANGFYRNNNKNSNLVFMGENKGEINAKDNPNEMRSKNKNRRAGDSLWRRKRNKQDSVLLEKAEPVNGSDQKLDVADDLETQKQHSVSKRSSKEKASQLAPRTGDDDEDDEDRENPSSDANSSTIKLLKEELCSLTDVLLLSVYEKNKIMEVDVVVRMKAFEKLKEIITTVIPDSNVRMYGSLETGVSTKSSDVNVDVTTKQAKEDLKTLKAAIETSHQDNFRKVELSHVTNSLIMTMDWCSEGEPSFAFTIKANVDNSIQTSQLLAIYSGIDKRVPILAVCLRIWAKIFQLDRQDEGTLPPHSFHLMVVHFMQKIQALPVLHELLQKGENNGQEERDNNIDPSLLEGLAKDWTPKKTVDQNAGVLWTMMLKYYDNYPFEKQVVNVRKSEPLTRNTLGWGSKNIAIEDPYCARRNLARSMCHSSIYKFFRKQLSSVRWAFSPQSFSPATTTADSLSKQYFSEEAATDMVPPKMCTTCQNIGHVKQSCPEEIVIPALPMPPPKMWVVHFIDDILEDVMAANEQSADEYRVKELFKESIEHLLRSIFPDKDPVLTLFGSSCNGFGFRKSDLDLSLSFKGQESLEMPVCVQIINKLADSLDRDERFREVIAITTAKVPIVKFCLGDFECDICLYNTLAQHNTRLLARYAELDRRARLLGYAIKHLAKVCHICDASKGSLSSYAYTLMAIYFLQRTVPPVLPVLQEPINENATSTGKKQSVMVEGWDVWFDDIDRNWKSENTQSSGQLWLEMVEFYSSYFDYENEVVCIRQRERLPKSEKNWNGSGIAIEDPFNLDHNLGARLTNRMSTYIRKAFQRTMVTFASEDNIRDAAMCRSAKHFLFNRSKLTDGPPPNDRGCRRCFKLGHFIADCPKLQKKKQKQSVDEVNDTREPVAAGSSEPPKVTESESSAQNGRKADAEDKPPVHSQATHSLHNNILMDKHQQHLQLSLPPPGFAPLHQSPQKRPVLQVPASMVPIMSQGPPGQMTRHFFPTRGFLLPQFQQFSHLQQVPMSMPGIQLRLPQTIPSLNTVFKRSDFHQPLQESHYHPRPHTHPHHSAPHNHHQHHLQQQQRHQLQQQQQQQHHQLQQQQMHHLVSNVPKTQFP